MSYATLARKVPPAILATEAILTPPKAPARTAIAPVGACHPEQSEGPASALVFAAKPGLPARQVHPLLLRRIQDIL